VDPRIRQLLDTIVNHYEVPLEEKAAELGNPAGQQMGEGSSEEAGRGEETRSRADDLADAFAMALLAARRAGDAPLRLNSADAIQNRMADALIQFLVRPGLATVQSMESGSEQFRYDISVDWTALRRVATQAGISLEEALGVQPA
jgi:hypothetical protein